MRAEDTLTIFCPTLARLEVFAHRLAGLLAPGDVLLLHGELGAGKTALTRVLARALGVGDDQYVSSPSFALLHEYSGRLPVFHMDLYRLQDAGEVEDAGLLDYLETPGICVVEWPDRLGPLTPDRRLELAIHRLPDQSRRIILTPHGGEWREKLAALEKLLA